MKVLFDHQIYTYQRYGGISRYFSELMNGFAASADIDFDIGLCFSDNEYIKNKAYVNAKTLPMDSKQSYLSLLRIGLMYFANACKSISRLTAQDFDVFHTTFYDPYFLKYLGQKPFVVTIYDMIPERYPQLFPINGLYSKLVTSRWIEKKRIIAQRANAIFAISENTKKDLIEIFNIDSEKIFVTHLGNSLSPNPLGSEQIAGTFPPRYILFVGTRNAYKNFHNFISAVKPLLDQDLSLDVVCVGGGFFKEGELRLLDSTMLRDRVYQCTISDAKLAKLYSNAQFFVFPSYYEGFGIPILEAFACGCPAAISDASCFSEIAGDAAIYFNPHCTDSITQAMHELLHNLDLREKLRAKGKERLKLFTWKKTVAQTIQLYSNILR
jgi:glycosyltransferase involved in cell wall biosynthesis